MDNQKIVFILIQIKKHLIRTRDINLTIRIINDYIERLKKQ